MLKPVYKEYSIDIRIKEDSARYMSNRCNMNLEKIEMEACKKILMETLKSESDLSDINWIPLCVVISKDFNTIVVRFRIIVHSPETHTVYSDIVDAIVLSEDLEIDVIYEVEKSSWNIIMLIDGILDTMTSEETTRHIISNLGFTIPVNRILSCKDHSGHPDKYKVVEICVVEEDVHKFITEFNTTTKRVVDGVGDIKQIYVSGGLPVGK